MEKVKIGGIRLSGETAMFRLSDSSGSQTFIHRFSRLLAGRRINAIYLSSQTSSDETTACCCVSREDEPIVRDLIEKDPSISCHTACVSRAGLVSIYPTRSGFSIIGHAVTALLQGGIQILDAATSISSLTLVIDFAMIPKAVHLLSNAFELPENHAPLTPQFKVHQQGPEGDPS